MSLNAPLEIANRLQVLVEFGQVLRTESLLDPGHVLDQRVEDAALFLDVGEPRRRICAIGASE